LALADGGVKVVDGCRGEGSAHRVQQLLSAPLGSGAANRAGADCAGSNGCRKGTKICRRVLRLVRILKTETNDRTTRGAPDG
jgi:hypothetical protein